MLGSLLIGSGIEPLRMQALPVLGGGKAECTEIVRPSMALNFLPQIDSVCFSFGMIRGGVCIAGIGRYCQRF